MKVCNYTDNFSRKTAPFLYKELSDWHIQHTETRSIKQHSMVAVLLYHHMHAWLECASKELTTVFTFCQALTGRKQHLIASSFNFSDNQPAELIKFAICPASSSYVPNICFFLFVLFSLIAFERRENMLVVKN